MELPKKHEDVMLSVQSLSWQLSELPWKRNVPSAHPSVLIFRCYCYCCELQRTTGNTWVKTLQNLCCQFEVSIFCGAFCDRELFLELSTDPYEIIGIAKLYYNALFTSPVIIRFLLNSFFANFPYAVWIW